MFWEAVAMMPVQALLGSSMSLASTTRRSNSTWAPFSDNIVATAS